MPKDSWFDRTVSLPPSLEIGAVRRAVEYIERELTDLARIHRFIQVDGVRTAEGCEGVTGAIIRA